MCCDPASLLTSASQEELRRAGGRISILGDNSAEDVLDAVGGGGTSGALNGDVHSLRI
jgi:hypothetical protein